MKTIQIHLTVRHFNKLPESTREIILANAVAVQSEEQQLKRWIEDIDNDYEKGFIGAKEWRNLVIDAATRYHEGLTFKYKEK